MSEPVAKPPRDELWSAVVGLVLWTVTFVVLAVFFRHDLAKHDATWWLWSCGIGVLLGLYGIRYALRRRARSTAVG